MKGPVEKIPEIESKIDKIINEIKEIYPQATEVK